MPKLLHEVIGQVPNGTQTSFSGAGRTQYTTAGELAKLTSTPVGQGDDGTLPRQDQRAQNLLKFLDKLGIKIDDYEFEVNHENPIFSDKPADDFEKNRGPGGGNRPADYAHGADHSTYSSFNESVTNIIQTGQIVEAAIMFRGLQKTVKVFWPSTRGLSRIQLQEDLNKILPSVVVMNIKRDQSSPGRLGPTPAILMEADIATLTEQGILVVETIAHSNSKAGVKYDSSI